MDPPLFLSVVFFEYWFLVVAAASGVCLQRSADRFEVDLEVNTELALISQARRFEQACQAILSRAYGFAGHSNKVGAVRLLLDEIRASGPDADEFASYMDAVFAWDIRDVPMILACYYLEWLPEAGDDLKACKLLQEVPIREFQFRLAPRKRESRPGGRKAHR